MTRAPIGMADLVAQHRPLRAELAAAFERVLDSGRFILGPEVECFEREVATSIGAGHAVGVSNGSDALLLALQALGVGPGDEVITTPFSFFATASAIVRAGARPVFVDIDGATFNLDVARVQQAVTPRTRAVIVVHLFGQPADLPALRALCDAAGLALVEDAAQAIGSSCAGVSVGTWGDIGCFSLFPAKNLGALGDAGLLTTAHPELAQRLRALRVHGAKVKYHHEEVGGNYRLDALQAALLRVKLPHLPHYNRRRAAHAAQYERLFSAAGLPADLLTPPVVRAQGHVYNQYTVRTPYRDALQRHLIDVQIGCEIYYPLPLHLQPCFAGLGYRRGDFPCAERAAGEVLSLPVHAELTAQDLSRVVMEVVHCLRKCAGNPAGALNRDGEYP